MQLFVVLFFCFMFVDSVPIGGKEVPNVPQCGVEASTNPLHHNPWLVFLEYYNEDGYRNIRCAGALIDAKHVLTAAHCVRRGLFSRLVVRLGEYDILQEVDVVEGITADPVVKIDVADVKIHEGFDGTENDIALLVLTEDAPYTDFIRPICLPTNVVHKGEVLHAAGWGELTTTHTYSHVKKNILLPTWSLEDCRKVYKSSNLSEKVICAGGQEGIDTCRGDSGGPFWGTVTNGKAELYGVTSAGNIICGTPGSPGIYTSVNAHLEWIVNLLNAKAY